MKSLVAAIVTPWALSEKLKFDKWEKILEENDHIKVTKLVKKSHTKDIPDLVVNMDAKILETLYDVRIYAVEDPSDSDQLVTGDPKQFIIDFLRQGLPKELRQSNIRPMNLVLILRRLANVLDFPSKKTFSYRRRLVASALRRIASYIPVHKLSEELGKKWDVKSKGSDKLIVNIEGIYKAEIELDAVLWRVSIDVPALNVEISDIDTDDPLDIYFDMTKDEEFRERVRSYYAEQIGIKTTLPIYKPNITVPAVPRPGLSG
jgi:hypothetical protein